MHRKHLRATVTGADVDIPIGTFAAGQFLRFVDGVITTGIAGDVFGPGASTDLAIARWDGVSGQLLQNSLVLISDTAQVTGVTALNGRDIARWTDGPSVGGATDNAIARWDTTTGRLLQNSTVVVDDTGAITGVTSINGTPVADFVRGPTPAVAADNNIATWDGISGRLIQDSGLNIFNVVYFLEAEAVTGHLPEFADSTGRRIIDSGIVSDHVVTSPAVGADNAVARYDGAARVIQTSTVTIDDSGNISGVGTLNGQNVSNFVRSSTSSVTNFEIALWFGTDGRVITGSGIQWNQVAYIGSLFGNDNRLVRTDTPTNNRAVQSSNVTLDDSGNLTGVGTINSSPASRLISYSVAANPVVNEIPAFDTVTNPFTVSYRPVTIDSSGNIVTNGNLQLTNIVMSGTLNSRDPDIFVAGPGGATDNRVARFDGTTGYLIQNSAVTIDDSGNITGVGTLNGITLTDLVTAVAAFGTDNRVLRSDGTGRVAQASAITLDDSGNLSGVGTITSGLVNGVNVAAHAARHLPSGADAMFATSSTGDMFVHNGAGAALLPKLRRMSPTFAGSAGGSYLTVLASTQISPNRAPNGFGGLVMCIAFIPYAISDTGSDIDVLVQWTGLTSGAAHVICGSQGGRISSSGGVGTFDTAVGNGVPAAGIIIIQWTATAVAQGATVSAGIRSTGSAHTIYSGMFLALETDS